MPFVSEQYRLDGTGGFSGVHKGTAITTGRAVAIKLGDQPRLVHEAGVYDCLSGGVGIAHKYCLSSGSPALILEHLGPDLETIFDHRDFQFSLKTVLLLADQLLSRVQYIHSKLFIHGDITPEHFAIGPEERENQIHVISFTLAEYYRDPQSYLHKPYCENEENECTVLYMSIHAHRNTSLSRRDDMESIGYVLLYFFLGYLPWEELDIDQDLDKMQKMKESIEESCPDLPVQFIAYFEHVRSLEFEAKPDYSYLRKIFRDWFEGQPFDYDYLFDWVDRHPTAIDVPRRLNDDTITEKELCESFTHLLSIQEVVTDDANIGEWLFVTNDANTEGWLLVDQGLSIQEPGTHEPSNDARSPASKELRDICQSILILEKDLRECLKLQNEDPGEITTQKWQWVVGNTRVLLYRYCKLLLTLKHPTASDNMKRLAGSVPRMMWRSIYALFLLMKKKQPSSINHFLDFACTAYGCLTVALDYAPQYQATWMECLADVSRFRMAMAGIVGDIPVMAGHLHTHIAKDWYTKAAHLNPGTGRIQHHLAVTARPDVLEQLFFFTKSLISVEPFPRTRVTIVKNLFAYLPKMTNYPNYPEALTVFVDAHRLLFTITTDDPSFFIVRTEEFLSLFAKHARRRGSMLRVNCVHIVACNYAAILGYGLDDAEIFAVFNMPEPSQASNMANPSCYPLSAFHPAGQVVSLASSLAFSTLNIILDHKDDMNFLPSVHVSLAFLWCLTGAPRAMVQIHADVPWERLADYLNTLVTPDTDMSKIENAEFPANEYGPVRQFPEDFLMRGLIWSQLYFPQDFFDNCEEGDERFVEFPPTNDSRIRRCLWLARKLKPWLEYDSEGGFHATEFARKLRYQGSGEQDDETLEYEDLLMSTEVD